MACLCVPDYKDRPREEVRRELEEHFRKTGQEMPFYRRVKVLRFWDGELPRTSTRKVKRKEVVEELKRLERWPPRARRPARRCSSAPAASPTGSTRSSPRWCSKPVADIRPDARLSVDLGFDSLMLTELSVALEQAGVPLPAVNDLTHVQTVDDLRKLVVVQRPPARRGDARQGHQPRDGEGRGDGDSGARARSSRVGRQLAARWASRRSTAACST